MARCSAARARFAGWPDPRGPGRIFKSRTAIAAGPGVEADLIVVNARVYTMDPALPRAEAFAVKDGRFLAVGSTADIRNLATLAHARDRRRSG